MSEREEFVAGPSAASVEDAAVGYTLYSAPAAGVAQGAARLGRHGTLPYVLIARMAHEVNRLYCEAMGDTDTVPWEGAPDWQRETVLAGVVAIAEGRISTPEGSHSAWMERKLAEGWTWGPVKDATAKTHPALAPYSQLPAFQRRKDELFVGLVVAALVPLHREG